MPTDQNEYGQPHPTRPSPTTQILDLERWLKRARPPSSKNETFWEFMPAVCEACDVDARHG
jgi:hypothetical protein